MKTLFLVTLATSNKVGELQALSRVLSSVLDDLVVSYLPLFIAKTELADVPLPRSFCASSLRDFAGDLEESSLLCPWRALRAYLERTKSTFVRTSTLFVPPCSPSRALSKNALHISYKK